MEAVDLLAMGGVQREVMKAGRVEVMRRRVAVLVGDWRQDQPLLSGCGIAPFPCSAVIVARDLTHPSSDNSVS